MPTFGEEYRKLRKSFSDKSLRGFCRENGFDASRLSKIELGKLAAPTGAALCCYLMAVGGISKELYDLAYLENWMIPADLVGDSFILERLPEVYEKLRSERSRARLEYLFGYDYTPTLP